MEYGFLSVLPPVLTIVLAVVSKMYLFLCSSECF